MERIRDFEEAETKVLKDMNDLLLSMKQLSAQSISDLGIGLAKLRNIRRTVYENLNQIQHEFLILQGLKWLKCNGFSASDIKWYWNPRQTGDSTEPDLRGVYNNKVIISVEATTSEKPQGKIDTRMRNTLSKLNEMEGVKYYFIRTPSMESRAITKSSKNGWNIKVVRIEH